MPNIARLDDVKAALAASSRPPAVVVGLCTHGLAIVRGLVRRGVVVVAVESNWKQPSSRTRYGLKLHHPDLYGPSLLNLLHELSRASKVKPVLFVTNDRMVRHLNRHQEALRRDFHLPFPRAELLDELIEKDTMTPLAVRQGLRIPRSWTVSGEAARDPSGAGMPAEIGFPCIVKPATPMSAIKVLLVPDRESFTKAAAAHPEIDRFIVQEWIEGDDERVHFTAYYFDREGRVRGAFAGQKIRQVPRTLGNSSAARGVYRPDLVDEGLKLFAGLGYRGIASVEFKLASDGTPYFIEATVGRSDYWMKTLPLNGVDLPALVYSDLTGVDLRAPERQRNRVAWVDGDRDLWVYLESWGDPACSKRRLLAQLLEPKRFALYDWRDPLPYLAWWGTLARRVGSIVARRFGARVGPVPA